MAEKVTYKWHNDVRRYRSSNGRFVSELRIRSEVAAASQRFSTEVYDKAFAIVNDFDANRFFSWSTETRRDIEDWHNALAIVALGGEQAVREHALEHTYAWAAVGIAVADQLRFFDRFMLGVVSGAVPLDRAMAARAALYPLAGYSMYENAVRVREVEAAGYNQERRILRSTNPCQTCIGQAALGWQPLGMLRVIGDSECMIRCYCYFEYRRVD